MGHSKQSVCCIVITFLILWAVFLESAGPLRCCTRQSTPCRYPVHSTHSNGLILAALTSHNPPSPPTGSLEIVIDLEKLTLSILVNREPFASYPIAAGKEETPSPVGDWHIVHKGYWVKGETPWLGLSVPFGVYGIHGTGQPGSIGRRASNGCIRMFNSQIEQIFAWVKVGTPVHIIGDPFRDRRQLKRGMAGSDVYFLQIRLKQLGYLKKKANGYFEYLTESALQHYQEHAGLPITGEMSGAEYRTMRLYWTD